MPRSTSLALVSPLALTGLDGGADGPGPTPSPRGKGFTDVTKESGIADLVARQYEKHPRWWLSGLHLVDLDGDGKPRSREARSALAIPRACFPSCFVKAFGAQSCRTRPSRHNRTGPGVRAARGSRVAGAKAPTAGSGLRLPAGPFLDQGGWES